MRTTRTRGALRVLLACAVAASLLALPIQASAGGKGGGKSSGGKLSATIAIAEDATPFAASAGGATAAAGEVLFTVTRSELYDKDTMWVTNKCWNDAGDLVEQRDDAIRWGMWDSYEGEAGPFPTAGTSCMAYVTLRPWQERPLGDALLTYDVSG